MMPGSQMPIMLNMEPCTSFTRADFAVMDLGSVYLKALCCYSGHVTPLEETPSGDTLRPNFPGQQLLCKGIPPTGWVQYTHNLAHSSQSVVQKGHPFLFEGPLEMRLSIMAFVGTIPSLTT